MAYNGTVELVAGIKPKNNGSFPIVNAHDVYVDDSTRLDAKLTSLGNSASIAPTEASSTASSAHAVGSYLFFDGTLYEVTAEIAVGDTITVGTNVATVPNGLSGEVSDLKSAINTVADEAASEVLVSRNAAVNLKDAVYWKQGNISSSGEIITDHTYSNIYTPAIIAFPSVYNINELQKLYLVKYKNGAFVSRDELSDKTGAIAFDSSFDSYRLMMIYSSQEAQYTVSQMIDLVVYIESNGRFDKLESDMQGINFLFRNNYIDLKDESIWRNGVLKSDGGISEDASQYSQSNIYTPAIITFPVLFSMGTYQYLYVAKYKNGEFVERVQNNSGSITPDSTFDSYRIMVTWVGTGSKTKAQMVSLLESMVSLRKHDADVVSNKVNALQNGVVPSWSTGVINSSGVREDGTNDNYNCLLIPSGDFSSIKIDCDSGYLFSLCKYNSTTFVQRSSWYSNSSGVVEVDNTYGYRINIAKLTASGSTIQQMLAHFRISISGNDIPTLKKESCSVTESDYLGMIACCNTGSKICHYSVDDTYAVLKDLTTNASTYASIFDNATLAEMLSIHNATGMCITLNTFNTYSQDQEYSISNVPEKEAFKTEFQANKGWLKFAFHAADDNANYDTASGISSAYDTFVSAIYKLTGDYDCIDRITRLGFFGGTLDNVKAIKDKTYGIIGLLCADETSRKSYYLSSKQNDIVQQKGMCIDPSNELIFIKTITRNLGTQAQNEVSNNICYQKYVEFFSHEYDTSWLTNCRTMCQWAATNGYIFAFPSLIFNVKKTF